MGVNKRTGAKGKGGYSVGQGEVFWMSEKIQPSSKRCSPADSEIRGSLGSWPRYHLELLGSIAAFRRVGTSTSIGAASTKQEGPPLLSDGGGTKASIVGGVGVSPVFGGGGHSPM